MKQAFRFFSSYGLLLVLAAAMSLTGRFAYGEVYDRFQSEVEVYGNVHLLLRIHDTDTFRPYIHSGKSETCEIDYQKRNGKPV